MVSKVTKLDFWGLISLVAQLFAYLLALILIIQIIRTILGRSWQIEEIILALVIFNLTVSFSLGGYLIHLNNKILSVNSKVEGHFSWHKGKDSQLKKRV